jgi:hypothetical protein
MSGYCALAWTGLRSSGAVLELWAPPFVWRQKVEKMETCKQSIHRKPKAKTNNPLPLSGTLISPDTRYQDKNIFLHPKEHTMKKILLLISILIISTAAFTQRTNQRSLTREEQLNKQYCTGLFSTPDGTYFDLESEGNAMGATSYMNILDWLQGRVAGLQVYNYQGTRVPFIRNSRAAVFVDEIRVDADFLNALPVNDIAMIKVIKTPFIGLWGATGGAIAIYTKDGEEE